MITQTTMEHKNIMKKIRFGKIFLVCAFLFGAKFSECCQAPEDHPLKLPISTEEKQEMMFVPGYAFTQLPSTPERPIGDQHITCDAGFGIYLWQLCDQAIDILSEESAMPSINGDVLVFGDVHGCIISAETILARFISEFSQGLCLLGLGDYVDRGPFGLEVLSILLRLKIAFPERVFLLAGNHECRDLNEKRELGGLIIECEDKFGISRGHELFEKIQEVWQCLPFAAIVNGTFFCVHGGISRRELYDYEYLYDNILKGIGKPIDNSVEKLKEDFEKAVGDKSKVPDIDQIIVDMKWNDPNCEIMEFAESHERGGGTFYFGAEAARDFLKNFRFPGTNLKCIVRGHQDGFIFPLDPEVETKRLSFQNMVFSITDLPSVINLFGSMYYDVHRPGYFAGQPKRDVFYLALIHKDGGVILENLWTVQLSFLDEIRKNLFLHLGVNAKEILLGMKSLDCPNNAYDIVNMVLVGMTSKTIKDERGMNVTIEFLRSLQEETAKGRGSVSSALPHSLPRLALPENPYTRIVPSRPPITRPSVQQLLKTPPVSTSDLHSKSQLLPPLPSVFLSRQNFLPSKQNMMAKDLPLPPPPPPPSPSSTIIEQKMQKKPLFASPKFGSAAHKDIKASSLSTGTSSLGLSGKSILSTGVFPSGDDAAKKKTDTLQLLYTPSSVVGGPRVPKSSMPFRIDGTKPIDPKPFLIDDEDDKEPIDPIELEKKEKERKSMPADDTFKKTLKIQYPTCTKAGSAVKESHLISGHDLLQPFLIDDEDRVDEDKVDIDSSKLFESKKSSDTDHTVLSDKKAKKNKKR